MTLDNDMNECKIRPKICSIIFSLQSLKTCGIECKRVENYFSI